MGHLTYEQSKSVANKTILILAAITIFEVLFALFAKGHLMHGVHLPLSVTGLLMVVMSIVKAYLIMYEFMHLKYEVSGLVKSILIPLILLIWAIIAFIWEGKYWNNARAKVVNELNEVGYDYNSPPQSDDIYQLG